MNSQLPWATNSSIWRSASRHMKSSFSLSRFGVSSRCSSDRCLVCSGGSIVAKCSFIGQLMPVLSDELADVVTLGLRRERREGTDHRVARREVLGPPVDLRDLVVASHRQRSLGWLVNDGAFRPQVLEVGIGVVHQRFIGEEVNGLEVAHRTSRRPHDAHLADRLEDDRRSATGRQAALRLRMSEFSLIHWRTMSDTAVRRRAAALPPEERRAVIVAATLALLVEHGEMVTTRQIADAVGIAEGTIFRAFPDKDASIAAVVDEARRHRSPRPRAGRHRSRRSSFEATLRADGRAPAAPDHRGVAADGERRHALRREAAPQPARERTDGRLPPRPTRPVWPFRPPRPRSSSAGSPSALTHPSLIEEPLPPRRVVELFLHGAGAR